MIEEGGCKVVLTAGCDIHTFDATLLYKNVFHKNKSRCRDGAKCLQRTHVPAWKNQLAEKLQEQGGVPFHAQQSRLTFSGIKDTLDTCSPSLHLATSVVVYMHML